MIRIFTILSLLFPVFASSDPLVVYSSRNEQLIEPIFKAYEKEAGKEIKFITGKPGVLIERLKAEGQKTKADILLTVDAGNLWLAEKEGLFQKTESKVLDKRIPDHLKDPQNHWFGFSLRARTIFYNKNNVDPKEITRYQDLANKKWQDKLCLRTSKKVYNMSLVAMLIDKNGKKSAFNTVKGWVDNLAMPVFPSDTKLLEAINRGDCALGIANTYYYGRLQKKGEAKNVGIHFVDDVHINISGAGILKNSKQAQEAKKFLEWLSKDKAQRLFADSNMEYPVVKNVDWHPIVKKWGKPNMSKQDIAKAGSLQREAVKIMEKANYK